MSLEPTLASVFECLEEPTTAVNLRRLFRLLMQAHWGDPDNLGAAGDDLKCLIWSEDEVKSKLAIELDHMFSPEDTDHFPGIFVGFAGGSQFVKLGLDNFAEQSADTSRTYYSSPRQATLRIRHIHSSPDTALAMAESTAAFFIGIRPSLMRQLGFRQFDPQTISDPRLLESEPRRFLEVDLTFQLNTDFVVTSNIESHRLKKFGLATEAGSC